MKNKLKTSIAIKEKLNKEFSPYFLEVDDVSEMHKGHKGYKEGQATHFAIKIKSEKFYGRKKVEIHRLINGILVEEWENGVHSISINAEA